MLVAHNRVMFGQHCHLGLQKGTKRMRFEALEKQFAYLKCKLIQKLTAKKEMPTAPSVPKRSPIQVLTGLDAA